MQRADRRHRDDGPVRNRWSVRRAVATLPVAGAVGVILLPDRLFGLDRWTPFAQLVSFRPHLLAVASTIVVVALLVVLLRRRRPGPLLAGCLVVVLVGIGTVVPRTFADAVPVTGRPLSVVALNVLDGGADPAELARLVGAERPDVVALTEAGEVFRSRLAPLLGPLGYRWTGTSSDPRERDIDNAVAGVAAGLGDVSATVIDRGTFPSLELTGGGLGELRLVVIHAAAPVPRLVAQWRSELAGLRRWCSAPAAPTVVVGDFNATLDHSPLRAGSRGCSDVADERGAGLVPTWAPSARWRAWGPQIDHVLTTGGIRAESFSVRTVPGTDHGAVVARLRVPG